MRIVKKFVRDDKTEFASEMFDKIMAKNDYPMPFERMEFHIRDSDVTSVDDGSALICINYNNPLVLEKDRKGLGILIHHELFRLMFKTELPRVIEDVIIGRELIKRGFSDDLLYMYYNYMVNIRVDGAESYIKMNLPWVIFRGYDEYNSEILKKLARKLCRKKFPETRKLFNILCTLPDGRSGSTQLPKNLDRSVEEYRKLVV